MRPLRTSALGLVLIVTTVPAASRATAAPIVSYTIGGEAGAWVLDFSVSNTLGVPNLDIYFFGVALPARDIVGAPPYWVPEGWETWSNAGGGGSSVTYNNGWLDLTSDPPGTQVVSGATMSGFRVRISTVSAPAAVPWFAFAYDFAGQTATYPGDDHFLLATNPGFEGIATVPEASTTLLLVCGLVALVAVRGKLPHVNRQSPL